ncbi:MAG: chitobiase/beta-hexosaminidase C-terminal domain-containing protein [Chitinophagaceae bacterium]|nr:chitobiase/beta-hexosaminidase C-terminal domain-containing protein [Chitinophagaceae bacterium]
MKSIDNKLLNIAIGCNALLAFLLLFEQRLHIPSWLQVGGRMHPLLLHLPITLVLIVALFAVAKAFFKKWQWSQFNTWLSAAACLAALTALSGLLLSLEEGYDADQMLWHKWSGIAVAWCMLLWAFIAESNSNTATSSAFGLLSLVGIAIAGHQGANITHGEDFLLAPIQLQQDKPVVLLEDALVFQDMVQPILEAKCISCHNEDKAKGELLMTSEAALRKGGKSGALWNLQVTGYGLMMDRIHLPLQDKKHMPPAGKPQLTAEESFIIEQWLAKGASFQQPVLALAENDTLRKMATQRFSQLSNASYDFEAADANDIRQLNTANRSVYALALNSPALAVEFYGRSLFQPAQLQELEKVNTQIVSLNLNKMPVSDEDLRIVADFPNLRKLNLSFTDITDKGLQQLSKLSQLQQLSVSGTNITEAALRQLSKWPGLVTVYAWQTKVPATTQAAVQQALGKTRIQWGFNGDTIQMKLNAPIIDNEAQVMTGPIELRLKHFLPGVSIRYTLDGSEPDSIRSPEYTAGTMIHEQGLMKAKAFKAGWISSDVSSLFFYKNKYRPDTAIALLPPDVSYKGNGAGTIIDNVKADKNFRSGKWLGYKENAMQTLLSFSKPQPVSSVTVSSMIDITSYIMPAMRIEVWGGNHPQQLKLLQSLVPPQPSKEIPSYLEAFELKFDTQTIQYLKLVAVPVSKLPTWHRGKGDKGWFFIDECFIN